MGIEEKKYEDIPEGLYKELILLGAIKKIEEIEHTGKWYYLLESSKNYMVELCKKYQINLVQDASGKYDFYCSFKNIQYYFSGGGEYLLRVGI